MASTYAVAIVAQLQEPVSLPLCSCRRLADSVSGAVAAPGRGDARHRGLVWQLLLLFLLMQVLLL